MKIPEFLFISTKKFSGVEYILETIDPHQIFRVYKFENSKELENFIIKYNLLNECVTFEDYNIIIVYVGDIMHFATVPKIGLNLDPTIKTTFPELKQFYEEERIKGNETRLKKFAKGQ